MQWLKLQTDILNDDKITIIRNMPNGDSMFVLWVGLLCTAMNKETDSLYVAEGVPYTAELLSKQLNIEKSTVELGLETFAKLHMIDICDTIRIKNFGKYQSLDKIQRTRDFTAKRTAKYREKKKALPAPENKDKFEYGENVYMTEKQYDTLVEKYGIKNAKKAITTLNNYKVSSGKTYKSDYHAILSWVLEKLKLKELVENGTATACKHCGMVIISGLCVNPDCPQYKKGE